MQRTPHLVLVCLWGFDELIFCGCSSGSVGVVVDKSWFLFEVDEAGSSNLLCCWMPCFFAFHQLLGYVPVVDLGHKHLFCKRSHN